MRSFVVSHESVTGEHSFLGPRVQMIIIEMEGCVTNMVSPPFFFSFHNLQHNHFSALSSFIDLLY